MAPKKATDPLGGFGSPKSFPPDAEKLLQEEIMKLSLQDRNDYQEEIHGVKIIAKEETPELLKESLRQLDAKLNSQRNPSFAHFLKSQQKLPTYVNTEAFRLRFLRSALFDVSTAAAQINDYLEHATELFGDYVLQRPIRISDFSKEELREFRKGRFQFLPYRDRAGKRGRRIFVVLPDQEWESMSWNLKRKIRTYMLYVAAEDTEAQKYGIVVIVWVDRAWMDVARSPWYKENIKPMGTRISSVHFCTPDTPKHRFFQSLFALRLNKERARLQIHVGTNKMTEFYNGLLLPKDSLSHKLISLYVYRPIHGAHVRNSEFWYTGALYSGFLNRKDQRQIHQRMDTIATAY